MTPILWTTIPGEPVAKGRPRMTRKGHAYTPARTRDAEHSMAWEIKRWIPNSPRSDDLGVVLGFWTATHRKFDVDNGCKLVLDAANGIVWLDDGQVTELQAFVVRGSATPRTDVLVYLP